MRLITRHNPRRGQAAVALLLAGLVLLLNAMAACTSLHEKIHKDADQPGHECAVTMFAHGKVDAATVDVSVVFSADRIEAAPPVHFCLFSSATKNLPPGRAPPSISSPQV